MSKEERLRRFFDNSKAPEDWKKEYARIIAFVEREGGVTITEDYPHMKLMNQAKYFADFRNEEYKILGKMLGVIR